MTEYFIQYSQIDFLNEFWQHMPSHAQVDYYSIQLFYDRGTGNFVFRELNSIFLINKSSLNKVTRIKIPYGDAILSLSVQSESKYVAYQTAKNKLNVFLVRQNRQVFHSAKEIIHHEWMNTLKGMVDLIVVESNGVRLFKIESDLKEVKHFNAKITCCWYEPKNETLVTGDSNGLLQSYFFDDRKREYKFKGPEFYLEDFQVESSFFFKKKAENKFLISGDKKNKEISDYSNETNYRIFLINNYGKTQLVYSNSFTGKVLFYQISYDKIVKQSYVLSFASDIIVQLSLVDELVVLSGVQERISSVYDVKKSRPEHPLVPPQPIWQQKDTTIIRVRDVQRKEEPAPAIIQKIAESDEEEGIQQDQNQKQENREQQENQEQQEQITQEQLVRSSEELLQEQEKQAEQVNFYSTVDPQKKQQIEVEPAMSNLQIGYDLDALLQSIKESTEYYEQFLVKMKWSSAQITQSEPQCKIYDDGCQAMQDDILINHKQRYIFLFTLNLKLLPEIKDEASSELQYFNALQRRSNSRGHLFEYLISLAVQSKPIQIMQAIYKQIFVVLIRALQENKGQQIDKIKNGYSVIYPIDMYQCFFLPLSETDSSRNMIVQYIVEFIRTHTALMREYKVNIPSQIQNLLIKLLIKESKFTYLHFLMQYQILQDNVDFAKLLIDISSREKLQEKNLLQKYQPYEPAFQLGIDMLYRLGKYEEILDLLVRSGRFHEAAALLKKIPLKIKLITVQEGIRYSNREDVLMFLEDLSRKQRLQFSLAELRTL